MKILLTGVPGTGKTALAKMLAKKINAKVMNEHDFAQKNKIGKKDKKSGELIIPLSTLEKKLNEFISDFDEKNQALKKFKSKKANFKNLIIEGHMVCETKLKADWIIVLRTSIPILWKRLMEKKYSNEKTFDNLSCEAMDYCGLKAKKNYPRGKILDVWNDKGLKDAMRIILTKLKGMK